MVDHYQYWGLFYLGYLKAYIEETCFIAVPLSQLVFSERTADYFDGIIDEPTVKDNGKNKPLIQIAVGSYIWSHFVNSINLECKELTFKRHVVIDIHEFSSVVVIENEHVCVVVSELTAPVEPLQLHEPSFYKTVK